MSMTRVSARVHPSARLPPSVARRLVLCSPSMKRIKGRTVYPRIALLLSYVLSGLLPNDDPDNFDAGACFVCCGSMFTG
jgi:hypothetical protein